MTFVILRKIKKIADFIFYGEEEVERIHIFETYSCLNASWNWSLFSALLNESIHWKKEIFKPKDAQAFYLPNGVRELGEVGTASAFKEAKIGEIIKNGWDHEHCEICYFEIGKNGNFQCYKYDRHWLCVNCFNKYASVHDLSFTDGL